MRLASVVPCDFKICDVCVVGSDYKASAVSKCVT